MNDAQIIDRQALDRLKEWGGDKLAGQMLRLFLKNSGTRMDQIRDGAERGDPSESERGSHSLKSSAANIGAELVRALATRMESASLEQDVDEIRRILPDLETAYSEAMAELASIEKGMRE
jgi:HPt (histidine-containing phosphotransfer) domain-containing protein